VEEAGLFRRLDSARRVVARLEKRKKRTSVEQSQLGAARKQITVIRERVVTANLPIVVNISQKMQGPGLSQDDFLSEGLLKLIQCVDAFDETLGYKFSTYLYRSLFRMLYRFVKKEAARNAGRIDDEDEYFTEAPVDAEPDSDLLDLREVLAKNHAGLNEMEIFLVRHSYGIGETPKTLHEIHVMIGKKKSGGRLQQILAEAIEKLAVVMVERKSDEAE
jgi:RNA polymerase sigma factor (sigma-70 family)